jgi:hypothetical protein
LYELKTAKVNRLLKNPDSRLFKKVQMQGAREIDERSFNDFNEARRWNDWNV